MNSVRISLRTSITTKSFSPMHPPPSSTLPFGLGESLFLSKTDVRDVLDDLDPTLVKRKGRGHATGKNDSHGPQASCSFSEGVLESVKCVHKGFAVLSWFAWCQIKSDSSGANKEMWCRCLLEYCWDSVKAAGACYREVVQDDNVQLNTGVQVAADVGYMKGAIDCFLVDCVGGGTMGLGMVGDKDVSNFVDHLQIVMENCRRVMNEVEGSASASAFECVRGKVDGLLEFSISPDTYSCASASDAPSEYVDQLISFLRVTFGTIDMLEGEKREGFCFGVVGHIASRIMGFLVNGKGEVRVVGARGLLERSNSKRSIPQYQHTAYQHTAYQHT